MKNPGFVLLVAIIITGCTSPQEKLSNRIHELEQIDTGSSHQLELAELYAKYVSEFEPDSQTAATYLERSGNFYSVFEKYDASNAQLMKFNKLVGDSLFFNSSNSILLAGNYRVQEKTDSAIWAYETTSKYHDLDIQSSIYLIMMYQKKARETDDRKIAAELHLKAANLLANAGNVREAVTEYTTYYTKFPEMEAAPYAMTKAAYLLEDPFNDIDSAKAVLRILIDRYPESNFAHDAQRQLELDLLGKPKLEQLRIIRENAVKN